MRGVRDVHIHDPWPHTTPPIDVDVNPTDSRVLLRDLAELLVDVERARAAAVAGCRSGPGTS